MPKAVRVTTVDSVADMIAAHGSAAWYGTKENFRQASYLLVVEKGGGPILLAPIDDIVQVPESGEKRWSMQFSRYVRLDEKQTEYRPVRSSNPAIVVDLTSVLPDLRIDDLQWNRVEEKTLPWSFSERVKGQPEPKKRLPRALTIAEAKEGLSLGLGVSEDQIDIIVRA